MTSSHDLLTTSSETLLLQVCSSSYAYLGYEIGSVSTDHSLDLSCFTSVSRVSTRVESMYDLDQYIPLHVQNQCYPNIFS